VGSVRKISQLDKVVAVAIVVVFAIIIDAVDDITIDDASRKD
jgi:hypothetical protein